MGSFLASSVEAPEVKLVIAHFSLILHTQENSGERDKESSLVIWNSRSGALLTRKLKSNIHPPKLFHGGWCQPRHFGAVTAKPGSSLQTEMRSANRHRFGDACEKAPQL